MQTIDIALPTKFYTFELIKIYAAKKCKLLITNFWNWRIKIIILWKIILEFKKANKLKVGFNMRIDTSVLPFIPNNF